MAAALVLIVGGVLLYVLTGLSPTVLAAQLTLDHVKCFAVHDADTPVDAGAGEQQYARDYGAQIHLPRLAVAGLQLVDMRRCFCGEGVAAHAMYRLNGRPVSLYVIPSAGHERGSADVFGHDAVIWSSAKTTYVLVGREPKATLEALAAEMDRGCAKRRTKTKSGKRLELTHDKTGTSSATACWRRLRCCRWPFRCRMSTKFAMAARSRSCSARCGGGAVVGVRQAVKPANLNFTLKDSQGKDFNLASQKGKVILLDFWATWCPPCKVEIPLVRRVSGEIRSEGAHRHRRVGRRPGLGAEAVRREDTR